MKFYPTKINIAFIFFVFVSILINFACSKDSDLLENSVLSGESTTSIQEIESSENEEVTADNIEDEASVEEATDASLEIRTSSFSPIHDAHVQGNKGYNQNIIRLEEGHRTSYLMFDLNPINEVNGNITEATLQFTIHSDDGSGTVTVFKGSSNEWTESDLSDTTAPEIENELGSIVKEYKIGTTELISLSANEMAADRSTLILSHLGGNDLAFASKEHVQSIGPKLVVTYSVPVGSEEIVIEETTTEETTAEETTAEETLNEESSENEEPMAFADATPSSGKAPLEVTFKGSNSSDDIKIESYSWDFKDGNVETTPDPVHTFTEIGEYEVELTVTDEQGLTNKDTVIITVTEDENEAPKAIANVTPVSGEAPLKVTFTGSNSTDDKSIASYAWKLNPGAANAADFDYTYTSPGTYEIVLTVKDENGLTDTTTLTVTVTEPSNMPPVAVASANPTSGEVPLNVQFTGTNSTDDKAISSYRWDFKDGSTATSSNPNHVFTVPGSYVVDLTVKDIEGISSTTSITINANEDTSSNVPPGYYVSTIGKAYNDGKSPSKPWSISHAFNTARAGDIVYVKAGNYGNINVKVNNSGTSGNPISFIGYKTTPGDINSSNGPTYTYSNYKSKGSNLDASKMPLLLGTRSNGIGNGMGIEIRQKSNIIIENFMIAKHEYGIFNTGGNNNIFKNIITTDHGDFNPQNSWSLGNAPAFRNLTGVGIRVVSSSQVEIINSIAINNGARGLALVSSQNSKLTNSSVYSDNNTNPTDYYIMIYSTTNSIISNCHVERVGDLAHYGHGISIKVDAAYNQFKNCTTKGTSFELNNRIHDNTFTDCHVQGTGEPLSGGWEITNYSHDNTFINCSNDSGEGIMFSDWPEDDGNNGINTAAFNNTFKNCVITNVVIHSGAPINFHFNSQAGRLTSYARDNTFDGCTFSGAESLFKVDRVNSGNKFINCTISDIEDLRSSRNSNNTGLQLGVSFQNTTTSNIGFTLPN